MNYIVSNYIDDLHNLFKQTLATDGKGADLGLAEALLKAAEMVMEANIAGKKTIFIGNGGSAAVASHKALDYWFTGKIRGTAFSDHANLTCVSNDFGYQNVFVKQIEMFADRGDILFAISSSGNSDNIVLAAKEARNRGCRVFTFSGFKETNKLRALGDLNFYTPVEHYNKVESLHLLLCDCILEIIVEKNNKGKDILVVFDRDGTILLDKEGYFGRNDNWREEIKTYEGAAEAIKSLNDLANVVVASNQIGVARGFYTEERVREINQFLAANLKERGAEVRGWYFSPYIEKRWAEKNGLDLNTPWVKDEFPETRKPRIGMLKQAASDLGRDLSSYKKIFVIGDSLDDLKTALNAGGIGIFFANGTNGHLLEKAKILEAENPGKIYFANDLISAAEIIKQKSIQL